MALSIVLLIVFSLIGFVAFWLGRRRVVGRSERRRLAPVFVVLTALLLVNGLITHFGRRSLTAVLDVPPLKSSADLMAAGPQAEVVAVGRLSPEAKSDNASYAVYIHCWSGCEYRGPKPLPVTLDQGTLLVVNSDFETREWEVRSRQITQKQGESDTYLVPASPVVVVGLVQTASPSPEIAAQIVFAGDYPAFREQGQRLLLLATGLLAANLLAALAALLVAAVLALGRPPEHTVDAGNSSSAPQA
jgi:hypothetical protein